jgi:serine/threonine protein kinase
MKYMPSCSLKDLLAREGRLPVRRAMEIPRKIADALNHANCQPKQLIYRNIKPGNFLT